MSIAKRLYLLMLASLICVLAIAGLGIAQLKQVYRTANYANQNIVPSLIDLQTATNNAAVTRARMWQYLALDDKAAREQVMNLIKEADHNVLAALDHYQQNNTSDQKDARLLQEVRAHYQDFSTVRSKAQDYAEQAANSVDAATLYSILIALTGLSLIAGMAYVLIRRITGALNYAIQVANTVAAGDLTQLIEIRNRDETGKVLIALHEMNGSLEQIVKQVRHSTESIANASTEITTGNHDLSSHTENQASSLQETASSMEQLSSTVKQNADNANQAKQLAQQASNQAENGGEIVHQLVSTMNHINQATSKIEDIIGVIDGIAFQTNILALNAAVEAARAGEQGRGFAVVATEVRTLAQRCAAAAKEIKTLIENSVEQIQTGAELADQAGTSISAVVESVHHIATVVSEISAASQEQTSGLQQINLAITQIDDTTQQNAARVEQATAAAASLQQQAKQLATLVSVFKLNSHATTALPDTKLAPATRQTSTPHLLDKSIPGRHTELVRQQAGSKTGTDDWLEF